MAWTPEQLVALDEAIAEGTLTVQYGDKRVTYRSLEEMLKVRQMMRAELGLEEERPAVRFARFSKGLE